MLEFLEARVRAQRNESWFHSQVSEHQVAFRQAFPSHVSA